MFFGYLGPLLIGENGADDIVMTAPRLRIVLAALLTRAGSQISVDELAEYVWDGNPPSRAAGTLRTYVMRLRHALGPAGGARVITRPPGYLIEVSEEEVDALRFTRAYHDGATAHRAGQWANARASLSEGLALWRGELLCDIPSQRLRDAERPALERLRLQALQWRIDADLRLGGAEELVPELQELTAREPLREQLYVLLMTALARSGRAGEALAVYRRARDVLVGQLGIEPGPELRELQRRLLAGEQVPQGPAAPIRAAARLIPRQLPAGTWHFAGREAELKALDETVDRSGVTGGAVTISAIGGMAGIGKTALALHWAHRVADRFPDGQLYVNLRGFDPAVPTAPADALRDLLGSLRDPAMPLPSSLDALQALYRSLMADRAMLVVLDNARDEEQVRPLLPGSANCLTLITSRNQLAGLVANGARPVRLDLLTDAEARELVGRRLGPDRMAAEPDAADRLIGACAGLPLALCIAGARATLAPRLPLASLAAQFSRSGLDVLSAPDPYADLRSVFSWSYRQLSADAASLFRRLPAVPGPDVSADAAASLERSGRCRQLLTELTSANLLEEYVPGRFRLHDLLAQYATECAEQEDTEEARQMAAERVLAWYAAAAAAASRVASPDRRSVPDLSRPDPMPAGLRTREGGSVWLEAERPNLIAAVRLADRLGFDTAAVTVPLALWPVLDARALWHDLLEMDLIGIRAARRDGDATAEAYLLDSAARAYLGLGQAERGVASLRKALDIRLDQADLYGEIHTRRNLGVLCFEAGQAAAAIAECEKAVALARESGNLKFESGALNNLGFIYQRMAKPDRALSYYLAARAIEDSIPEQHPGSATRTNLASAYVALGRTADAIAAATAAVEYDTRHGNQRDLAEAHLVLGDALDSDGRRAEARMHWRAALDAYEDMSDAQAEEASARLAADGLCSTFTIGPRQRETARTPH